MKSANIRSTSPADAARPSSLQPAFDHPARAAADHVARRVVVDRRQAFAREHDIERVDQVGRGVDQRAVEIEDDGEGGHAFRLSFGRAAIAA